jgi:hypothetical protein
MTRVTTLMRDSIHLRIMKNLPSRDFAKEIHVLVQSIIVDHMPKEVRALYDSKSLRGYLHEVGLDVHIGNQSVPLYRSTVDGIRCDTVVGLTSRVSIRMDDHERLDRLPEGSLYRDLVTKLHASRLVSAFYEQEDLRKDVARRVRANLASASTVKRLYEVLEPELHHYIPKDPVVASLPACVTPVVDDLRKLGAVLPDTPKIEV